MVKTDPTASLRAIATSLDLTKCSVQIIISKIIGLYPYKPQTIQTLTLGHNVARKKFCEWFLEQPEDFHKTVLWSDEKLWVQTPHPNNKQNERYLTQCIPHSEV